MKKKKPNKFPQMLFHAIAEDTRLTLNDKLVAAYIYTLHRNNQIVTASNGHIAFSLNIPETTCHDATMRLVKHGIIDIDRSQEKRKLIVLRPTIVEGLWYQIPSEVLNTSMTIAAKFLFIYILSILRTNETFYAKNPAIKKRIGLGKDSVTSAAKNLVEVGLIGVLNPRHQSREYYIKTDVIGILKGLTPDTPNSESDDSVDRIDSSELRKLFTDNRQIDTDSSSIDSVNRSNKVSDNVSVIQENNVSLLDKSNNDTVGGTPPTEGVDIPFSFDISNNSTKEEFGKESELSNKDEDLDFLNFLSSSVENHSNDSLPIKEEADEVSYSNGTKVTIDDLISNISMASPEEFCEIGKLLQQEEILPIELLPSKTLRKLRDEGDLSNFILNNRINIIRVNLEFKLQDKRGNHSKLSFSAHPFGFDPRVFHVVGNLSPTTLVHVETLSSIRTGNLNIDDLDGCDKLRLRELDNFKAGQELLGLLQKDF